MTQSSRAAERSKFSLHRAALMFSSHIEAHPRAQAGWEAMIDEGSEPHAAAAELRRLHIRDSLMGPIQTRRHAI